jgi:hypothetical protein
MDLFAGWFIVRMATHDARQALPDAPVRPDRRGRRSGPVRRRSAAALRRLADHFDPRPGPERCST